MIGHHDFPCRRVCYFAEARESGQSVKRISCSLTDHLSQIIPGELALKKLTSINGLRGCSILLVILFHMFHALVLPGLHSQAFLGLSVAPTTILTNGWLAVNLFFVLSGFVLALPYFSGTRAFAGAGDVRWFWKHRFARLYPLYAISVIVALVFYAPPSRLTNIPGQLILLLSGTFVFTKTHFAPVQNFILWSLAIELQFSILFPFLMIVFRRYPPLIVYAAVALISLVLRFAGLLPEVQIGQLYLNPLKDCVLARLDDFSLGILLACAFSHRLKTGRSFSAALAFPGILLWLGACIVWDNVSLGLISSLAIPFTNLLVEGACACFVLAAVSPAAIGFRFARFLSNRPLQLLGMMCYSLYIWHAILLRKISSIGGGFSVYPIYAGLLFLLSWLTYRYVEFGYEKDFRKLLPQKPDY